MNRRTITVGHMLYVVLVHVFFFLRHESSSFPFFSFFFPFISPSSGGEMGPPGPFTLQYGDAMPCLHRESTAEFRLLFTAPLPNGHNTTNQR